MQDDALDDGAELVGPLPLPLLGAPEGLLGLAVGCQGGVDEGAEVALMIEIKVDNVTTAVNVKYQWNIMSDLLKGRKKKPYVEIYDLRSFVAI